MLQEADIVPYHLSLPPGERIVLLAPHPDDETLGCGGTIRLLRNAGKEIKVVFLTSGDKADPSSPKSRSTIKGNRSPYGLSAVGDHMTEYALIREREAEKALKVLGVDDYVFMRFPDREVHSMYKDALGRLSGIVLEFLPDTIYAPSMIEVNPDHRAAAAMAMDIQRNNLERPDTEGLQPISNVFYEITTPLRPNILVDITSVYNTKKRATKRYRSQLRLKDYLRYITSLNTVRSLTVSGSRHVEAFWLTDRPLTEEEIIGWLGYREVSNRKS